MLSGRRDSNPQPSAWEADALPLRHYRMTRLKNNAELPGKERRSDKPLSVRAFVVERGRTYLPSTVGCKGSRL